MEETPYISAVFQNDQAHIKTLREEALAGTLTKERVREIEEEAKTWLRLLEQIHRNTRSNQQEDCKQDDE